MFVYLQLLIHRKRSPFVPMGPPGNRRFQGDRARWRRQFICTFRASNMQPQTARSRADMESAPTGLRIHPTSNLQPQSARSRVVVGADPYKFVRTSCINRKKTSERSEVFSYQLFIKAFRDGGFRRPFRRGMQVRCQTLFCIPRCLQVKVCMPRVRMPR